MTIKKNISLYLPYLSAEQLFARSSFNEFLPRFNLRPLSDELESFLCQEMALETGYIAWNKIRARQFNIPPETQTVVCCDPVMMQMTHRGAYLWGQSQLNFSNEEVIQIIAQINQQLMGESENFFLLDNQRWLYTNKAKRVLEQTSFDREVGKDRFGFSYSGLDGLFWDRLATEIQMLIKQMMDYQGLTPVAPEMMVNVHFWGNTEDQISTPFETPKNLDFQFYTSDFLYQSFCANSQIPVRNMNEFDLVSVIESSTDNKNPIIIFSPNEHQQFENIIAEYLGKNSYANKINLQIITQDKQILLNNKPTILSRIKSIFIK